MQTNVCGIWKRLNEIDDSESLDLLEFARFPKTKDSELKEFEEHADKHRTYIINGKEYMMTNKEYDDNAHELSSYPAIPIGTGSDIDIFGYITQDGRKVKFVEIPGGAFMVAYVGNDMGGRAVTFMYTSISALIFSANPFRKIQVNGEDHRYKSDLDGGFVGLKYFKPITNGSRGVTKQEIIQIRDDILNGRKISVK